MEQMYQKDLVPIGQKGEFLMKIYCITENNDLEVGLKLAGCDGITLQENDNIEEKIDEVVKNKEIGILVVSKEIYKKSKEKIDDIRINKKLPLITII